MKEKQQPEVQAKPSQPISQQIEQIIWFPILLITLVVGLAWSLEKSDVYSTRRLKSAVHYALIGDIGGTNIRYQLVSFRYNLSLPLQVIKQQRLKVVDFDTFQASVTYFLSNISSVTYPDSTVIAIAGPIQQNTVIMPNIPKWGQLNGTTLTTIFNMSTFLFINDFQAASYGLLITQDTQLIKLNNLQPDSNKIRGVIGPGTGLGHSVIFNHDHADAGKGKNNIKVLPSEAGHSDVPYIDRETSEYIEFLKTKIGSNIDLEKTFCGPSIPLMYEFYSQKLFPNSEFVPKESPEIVEQCIKENPQVVYQKVFQLFMKFYSSAIANFMIQHMTTGGVYLVGGLTKAFLKKIEGTDILEDWKKRHPDMTNIVEKIPLIFCTEVDLGLRGAFYMAKRMAIDQKIEDRMKKTQEFTL